MSAKKPDSTTGVRSVPAPSGKVIRTAVARRSVTRPNSRSPSLPGSTLNSTSSGRLARVTQALPLGPLRGFGPKWKQ
ncbi:hypothetical protein J5X84_07520 [Streptosporangiaceae bacterium NEAU-GS5]|nr:hypothetical protein [Streptosporangiaceae bacterium NEAU-GS5]